MNWQLNHWWQVEWMTSGSGHEYLDILLTLLTFSAAGIYMWLLRTGSGLPLAPPARTIVMACRRIKCVGYSIFAVRYIFVLATTGDIIITVVSELAFCAIIMGDLFVGMLAALGHPSIHYQVGEEL